MKDKLSTIILLIIFIGLLIWCSNFVNQENLNVQIQEETQNVNNQNIENYENNEEELSMEIISISNENFENEVLKSEKIVLVDFYADWCGPCKMLSPIVEQIAKEHEDIKVVKVNVDDNQELAVQYGVVSIPTLVVIKDGLEKTRTVGVASQSEIEKMIYN